MIIARKLVVLSEASSTSPAHYSGLFAWTLQKPEVPHESYDNAKLKNTS